MKYCEMGHKLIRRNITRIFYCLFNWKEQQGPVSRRYVHDITIQVRPGLDGDLFMRRSPKPDLLICIYHNHTIMYVKKIMHK